MLKYSIKTCTSVRTALTYLELNTDRISYNLVRVLSMVRTHQLKRIDSYLDSGYVWIGFIMLNVYRVAFKFCYKPNIRDSFKLRISVWFCIYIYT